MPHIMVADLLGVKWDRCTPQNALSHFAVRMGKPMSKGLAARVFPQISDKSLTLKKTPVFFKISPRSCTVAVPLKGPLETPTDRKKNKPQFPVLLLKILGFTVLPSIKHGSGNLIKTFSIVK